jgi:hypothetical protein
LVNYQAGHPGLEAGLAAKAIEVPERREVGRLNGVLRLLKRVQESAGNAQTGGVMPTEQLNDRLAVSLSKIRYQIQLRFVLRPGNLSHFPLLLLVSTLRGIDE